MTSGLCSLPQVPDHPSHLCPHNLGGEWLAGWASDHQAITTGPAAAPYQPGTPLLSQPGPEVQAGETQDWPMATEQLGDYLT